ncbi:DUF2510 domain-containing protein [Microbacterium sp. ANT_H45B]|uniref:DUF2510 domain-containing protein n=1 Tax=Microbacterium sp. ANT_H45B TaxID=2597346 RepID=UPI0011EBE3E6|nr:DUF2510 domain-containing protein [Microbacterium sp. ANT_H45B]KAA0960874.1 DUF2510 domain-containing protein [Microbacterium sp. ANT_H45B]
MSDQLPPPGWYAAPHANNEERYWDGAQWLEHPPVEKTPSRLQAMASNVAAKHDASGDADTIWSAVGKPLTGIGGGRYKLTDEYLFHEKGTLSTKAQQIRTADIYDVDSAQTLAQKARGIGTITLYAQRGADQERERVVLEDVPDYREGVNAINRAAHTAREARRVRENTQHVNYSGGAPVSAQPTPTVSPSPAFDLNAELTKLGELKAQGILDDEEFRAAKRQLLGL